MRRAAVVLVSLLATGAPAGAARVTASQKGQDKVTNARSKLQARSMRRFLSKKKNYRKLSPPLPRGDFAAKFQTALEAPANLVRSYAGVFWHLARKAPPKRRLAKIGTVFGDAHHEQFGFVRVDGKTVFGMTDYDDSGRGFVDDDAAHYFAELRLAVGKKLAKQAIEQYAATIADPAQTIEMDPELAPDWAKTSKNDLERTVRGKRFLYGKETPGLRPVGASERPIIEGAVSKTRQFRGLRVLDVAELRRINGGSGGLTRYWLLVEPTRGGDRFTIELKEIGTPGVVESGVEQEPNQAKRLRGLKKAFWGSTASGDWFPMDVNGTAFLVRNRHTVEKVNLGRLEPAAFERVIMAQASYMAKVHRPAWRGVSATDIEKNVADRTADFARAYQKAHERLTD